MTARQRWWRYRHRHHKKTATFQWPACDLVSQVIILDPWGDPL